MKITLNCAHTPDDTLSVNTDYSAVRISKNGAVRSIAAVRLDALSAHKFESIPILLDRAAARKLHKALSKFLEPK